MSTDLVLSLGGIIVATSLLMALAWLITKLLHSRSAALRHMVWTLAFISATAVPIFRFSVPGLRFEVAKPAAPIAIPVEQPATTVEVPQVSAYEISNLTTQPEVPSRPLPYWALGALWAGGVALVAGNVAVAAARLSSLGRRGSLPAIAEPDLSSLSRRACVRRGWLLRVCIGPRPATAMTWGFAPPVVLLPEEAISWPRERLEAVLLHELAHVRRLDSISQVAAVLVCALYWFNPIVWLCARAMRAEAETAADDLVLNSGVAPSAYAEMLVRMAATLRQRRQPFATIGVSIMKRSKIEKRVEVILNPRARRGATLVEMLAVACAGLAAFLPLTLLRPALAQEPPPQPPAQSAPPPPAVIVQGLPLGTAPAPAQARPRKSKAAKRGRKGRQAPVSVPGYAVPPPAPGRPIAVTEPDQRRGNHPPALGSTAIAPVPARLGNEALPPPALAPAAVQGQSHPVAVAAPQGRYVPAPLTRAGTPAPASVGRAGLSTRRVPEAVAGVKELPSRTPLAIAPGRRVAGTADVAQTTTVSGHARPTGLARTADTVVAQGLPARADQFAPMTTVAGNLASAQQMNVRPGSAAARHLAELNKINTRLNSLIRAGSGEDSVEIAKVRLQIAEIQYKLAVEMQKERRAKSRKG